MKVLSKINENENFTVSSKFETVAEGINDVKTDQEELTHLKTNKRKNINEEKSRPERQLN